MDRSPIANGSHGFYEAMAGVYLSFKRELQLLDRFERGAFNELTFMNEFEEMSPHILFTETEATQIRRELEHVLNAIDLAFRQLKTNIGEQQVNNPEDGRIPSENPYSDRVHLMGQALRNLAISTLQDPVLGDQHLSLFITADEREADNVDAVSEIINDGMRSNQLRDLRSYAKDTYVDWEERGRYVARHALAETIRTPRKEGVYPFEVELMAQLCNVFIYVYDRADVDTDDVRHADLKYIRASNFIQFGTDDTPVLRVSIGEHVTGPANGMQYSYCAIGRAKTQARRYKRTVNQRNVVEVLRNPQAVVKRANEDGVRKTQEQIDAESAKQLSDIAAVRKRAFRYQLQRWGGRPDFEITRELQEQEGVNVMFRMNTWSDDDEDDVEEGEVGGGAIVSRKKPASGGAGGSVADAMRRSNEAARQAARQAAAKSAGPANEVVQHSMARKLAQEAAEKQAQADREEEEAMLAARQLRDLQSNINEKVYLDKRVRRRLPSAAEEKAQAWKWNDLKNRSVEKGAYEAAKEMMEEYAAKMDEEMFERVRQYYAKKERFEAEREAWRQRHSGARSQRYVQNPKDALREFEPLPTYLQRWESERVERERWFTHGSIWLYYNGEWFLGKQGPRDLWSNSKPTQSWTKVANNIAHILWLRYTGRVLPDYKRLIPERSAEEEVALRRQRAVNKNAMRGHMHRPNLAYTGKAAETPEEMDEVRELRCQAFEWLYTSANIFQDPRLTYTNTQYTVDEREALQLEYEDFMSAERKHLMNILKDCTTDATQAMLNRRYEEDSRSFTVCDDPSTTPAPLEGDGDAREERRLAGPTAAQKKAKYLGERESRKPLLDDPFRGEQRVWSTGLQAESDVPVGETPRERTKRQKEYAARVMEEMALWEHPDFPSDVDAKETFEEVMTKFQDLTLAKKNTKEKKQEKPLFERIAKVGFPARGGLQPCKYGRMPGPTEPGHDEAMLRWWQFEKELSADGTTKDAFAWHAYLDADPLMGFPGYDSRNGKKVDERYEEWKLPKDVAVVDNDGNPLAGVPSVEAWKSKWGGDAEAALLLKVLREYLHKALEEDPAFTKGPGVPDGWIGSYYATFDVKGKQKDPEIRANTEPSIQAFVNKCNLLPIVKAFRTALLALFPEPTGPTGLNGIMEFVNWFHLATWPSDGSLPMLSDAEFDARHLDPLCQILCLPMISTWTGFEKRVSGDFFEEHKTHERVLSELKKLFIRIMFVRRALDYAASSHAQDAGGVLHKPANAKVLEHWQKLTVPVGVEDDYVSPEAAQEAQRKKYENAANADAPMMLPDSDSDDDDDDVEMQEAP